MEIIEYLFQEKGLLTKEQAESLKNELPNSSKKAEELILEKNFIEEQALFQAKSEMLDMPLKNVNVDDVSLKALNYISEDSARYYQMVPLALQEDGTLDVGMVYPQDLSAQSALTFLARQGNFSYKVHLISPVLFRELIKKYRDLKGEVKMALEELEEEVKKEGAQTGKQQRKSSLSRVVEEAPVTKMVGVIVRNAIEGGASDIHIEAMRDKVRVRFRFLGELHSSLYLPLRVHSAIISRLKILSDLKIDETRVPQDGRFSMEMDGRTVDFRIATFPTSIGEKVAIRILDPESALGSFEELGLEGYNLKKVKDAIRKPYGMVLVTGPTGSGKTTTLYTILRKLNDETVNIVSLEDPVEYLMQGVNQSQVHPEIGYDFAQGLRQILRQDPDIIMVGEVRDEETASLVTHAALTGHIVLSTLHTNNAFGIIPRLVDMGVERYLIPVTMNVGIAQRLVRQLCQTCKKQEPPSKAFQELIMQTMEEVPLAIKKTLNYDPANIQVFKSQGCKECGSSGFSGRIGIFEVIEMTDAMAEIILEDPSEARVAAEATRQGMITMFQDGIIKVLDGVTTVEEILRVAEQ